LHNILSVGPATCQAFWGEDGTAARGESQFGGAERKTQETEKDVEMEGTDWIVHTVLRVKGRSSCGRDNLFFSFNQAGDTLRGRKI
jgi:hypothetical protein